MSKAESKRAELTTELALTSEHKEEIAFLNGGKWHMQVMVFSTVLIHFFFMELLSF